MLAEWLDHSLEARPPAAVEGEIPGGRFRLLAPGVLELVPDVCSAQAQAGVISVGIHGNETAPIELLGATLARLEAGLLRLAAPLLVILGHPAAIRHQARFVTTNLNRLFRRELEEKGAEPDRARTLMAAVDGFYARHPDRDRWHYDLHTAIRDSRFPRFVVEPFANAPTPLVQWRWLAAAGIQAVLHQHRHSWTFSHYAKHYHGAAAFTFELGRARPFGHNDLTPLAAMGRLLEALIEDRAPPAGDPGEMVFFRAEHELLRHSERFRLCFPDDTANFSEFPPHSLLAHDAAAGDTRVGERPVAVVFPNAEVEIGARAALLVVPCSPPT